MTLRISGKSISVGEALRNRVSDRTDEVLRKYFDGNYSGHVTLSKDGFGFRTDCALHLDSGVVLEATSGAADAYASADQALLMIEKRLRRYKRRLKDHYKDRAEPVAFEQAGMYVLAADEDEWETQDNGPQPMIIAEMETRVPTVSVGEAVMQMELAGSPMLVFRNEKHGGVNVVYRREDGNVGWIDPRNLN